MADRVEKKTAAQAFGDFARKFARSPQFRDTSRPHIVYEDDLTQKKINAREQEFRENVLKTYSQYLAPQRAFGKNSRQAEQILVDEQHLLQAYNLFKAVREANMQVGDAETFVAVPEIHSPLVARDCYTSGGAFIYLQCWLMFAQNVRDFVPELVGDEVSLQTVWRLQFSPLKTYGFNYQDKEVMAVIREAFPAA